MKGLCILTGPGNGPCPRASGRTLRQRDKGRVRPVPTFHRAGSGPGLGVKIRLSERPLHIDQAGQPPAWAGAFRDGPYWRWFCYKAHTLQWVEMFKAPAGGQAGAARRAAGRDDLGANTPLCRGLAEVFMTMRGGAVPILPLCPHRMATRRGAAMTPPKIPWPPVDPQHIPPPRADTGPARPARGLAGQGHHPVPRGLPRRSRREPDRQGPA